MSRLDEERRVELEPQRMEYAIERLNLAGYEVLETNVTSLKFSFNGHIVTLFPYSGWFTGKSVKDGRGIDNLIKQITPKMQF